MYREFSLKKSQGMVIFWKSWLVVSTMVKTPIPFLTLLKAIFKSYLSVYITRESFLKVVAYKLPTSIIIIDENQETTFVF